MKLPKNAVTTVLGMAFIVAVWYVTMSCAACFGG